MVSWTRAPFGISDLEENAAERYRLSAADPLVKAGRVRCCVRGCDKLLAERKRSGNGADAFCPAHGVSVSHRRPTYVYRDHARNFIVGQELLSIIRKVERKRLGNENSEDALTWNAFLGLSRLGALSSLFPAFTGEAVSTEPELYLWGNRVDMDGSCFWPRLIDVRRRLEKGLTIPTEPDVILRVPGRAIVLVEAKFGSANSTLAKKQDSRGPVHQFLERYCCRQGLPDPLNREWIRAQQAGAVLGQLCRNVIFAHWLAEDNEKAFVVSLVREKEEQQVVQQFRPHLSGSTVGFRRVTWEQVANLVPQQSDAKSLREYLANKTLNLRKAFAYGP
jgi:hypothetical protein